MIGRLIFTIACASFVHTKPIMVSFGTKGGPIVPPTPSTTTLNPLAPKNPAPVYEDQSDDIPPPVYRAPTPNQYRNLINSYKPNPNIQLGTPLDIKYADLNTLSQLQVQQQKAEFAAQQGLGYTGAQVFGVQAYEYDNARNRQQQLAQQQGYQGQSQSQRQTNAQAFVQQYIPRSQQQPQQNYQNEKQQVTTQASVVSGQNDQKQNVRNVRQQRHEDKDQVVQASVGNKRYTSVYSVREPQQQQQQQQQPEYRPQGLVRMNYHYNGQQNQQNGHNLHHGYNQHNQHNQDRQHNQQIQFYNQQNQQNEQTEQNIPGFGVAFSSGLRYYVPQYYYFDSRHQQPQQQQQYQNKLHKSQQYNEVNDNAIYGH